MPCSILLEVCFEACGRIRSTLSGQKCSSKMKTSVTRKLASRRVGTTITSCSYTRISANRSDTWGHSSLTATQRYRDLEDLFVQYVLECLLCKNWMKLLHHCAVWKRYEEDKTSWKTYRRWCLHGCSGSLLLIMKTSCQMWRRRKRLKEMSLLSITHAPLAQPVSVKTTLLWISTNR